MNQKATQKAAPVMEHTGAGRRTRDDTKAEHYASRIKSVFALEVLSVLPQRRCITETQLAFVF